ncbi:hypothetical protein EC12264_4269 [Escherichia coli 1.2264]|nr:hypothetical protein EC12264_4269 [Escherichia coli 1.2264]
MRHLLVYWLAFSNGNAVARTDVAIWREIIVRKYLLFFNERVVW